MSHVVVPFKTVVQPQKVPTKVLIQTALQGRLKLWTCSGDYEIELDGQQVLAPTDERAATVRFNDLANPKAQPTPDAKVTAPEPDKFVGTHCCPDCGKLVSDERLELLGTETCEKCTPQGDKVLGVLDYSHKTGGVLMLTSNRKHFEMMKKPINQQR